jgi:hypothetical protein
MAVNAAADHAGMVSDREATIEAVDDAAFETLADVQTSIGPLTKAMSIRRRRSYLDALDSHHRPMMLRLESDELVRKPSTATQKRRMPLIVEDLRRQVRAQMQRSKRRAFRGDVSVHLDLHATSIAMPPSSPPAVKAYLDLLQGLVYADDRQIRHLRVTRHANDNPILAANSVALLAQTMYPRYPHGPHTGVEVRFRIEPLRTYISDYDRVFECRPGLDKDDLRYDSAFPYWDDSEWHDPIEGDRLQDLEEDEADDMASCGIYTPGWIYDGETEARIRHRSFRRAQLAGLRARRLLGGRLLGPDDRPGLPSPLVASTSRVYEGSRPMLFRWFEAPVSIVLPLPPTKSSGIKWRRTVEDAFEQHRDRWMREDLTFEMPVALDIAVGGASPRLADLDNLAQHILEPFERLYCAGNRGTVASYRVYEAHGDHEGVRVLVIGDDVLHAFETTIQDTRHRLLASGPLASDD